MAKYNIPIDVLAKLKKDWIPRHSTGTAYVSGGKRKVNYGKDDIRVEEAWDIRSLEGDARDYASSLERAAVFEATSRVTKKGEYLISIRKLPGSR